MGGYDEIFLTDAGLHETNEANQVKVLLTETSDRYRVIDPCSSIKDFLETHTHILLCRGLFSSSWHIPL